MKRQKCNKQKNLKSGFTLLELLVVVLIIGILAGIALPQYRFSVGKSQYSTLKHVTRNVRDSVHRYTLANDNFYNFMDFDKILDIKVPSDIKCTQWTSQIACYKQIYGETMYFYVNMEGKPFQCCTSSLDTGHITHRICQNEMNRKSPNFCWSAYCCYNQ